MSKFIQLHLLTFYPPSNLNRDDLGRPKTARMGGFDRLRVSSQSLKRTWRTSDIFQKVTERQGKRTRDVGLYAKSKIESFEKLSREDKFNIALNLAKCFGKPKAGELTLETAVFISTKEFNNIDIVMQNFKNGIDDASVDVFDLGVEIFKALSGEAFSLANNLADKLLVDSYIFAPKKSADFNKTLKEYKDKTKDKTTDIDRAEALILLVEKNFEKYKESLGQEERYTASQFVTLLLSDIDKKAKSIARSLGALNSKKESINIEFGELCYKKEIKLATDWKELVLEWYKEIDSNEDLSIDGDKSKEILEQYISPAAISRKQILTTEDTDVDISLFGRMLASSPEFNKEASCQVAHAISVHSVMVEDDYFTAVEELNFRADMGSAHIGETGFASALFYSYICIDKSLLIENLDGDEILANKAIKALTEAATTVSPKGKQNSFASRAYASYVFAEKGEQQPRSLSVSFLNPIKDENQGEGAIEALENQVKNFNKVYEDCAGHTYKMNALKGAGSLAKLLEFVVSEGSVNDDVDGDK